MRTTKDVAASRAEGPVSAFPARSSALPGAWQWGVVRAAELTTRRLGDDVQAERLPLSAVMDAQTRPRWAGQGGGGGVTGAPQRLLWERSGLPMWPRELADGKRETQGPARTNDQNRARRTTAA